MAKFDISAAASRFTGLEPRMRNESIRKELDTIHGCDYSTTTTRTDIRQGLNL
jgi:hypothetical protein